VIAEAATYTTHNKTQGTKNHTLAGFEPAIQSIKMLQNIYAFDRTATGIVT
jgi:hypothetical protein